MRRTALLCAATIAAVSVGAPALAARKPSSSTATTFTMRVLTGADQEPSWGDEVTFDVNTSATSEPHVDLSCTQGGVGVYGATTGFYDGYPWPWTQVMTLRSQDWSTGAADCTARLYAFNGKRTTTLATISFSAQG